MAPNNKKEESFELSFLGLLKQKTVNPTNKTIWLTALWMMFLLIFLVVLVVYLPLLTGVGTTSILGNEILKLIRRESS
jgi:hypothetical protein